MAPRTRRAASTLATVVLVGAGLVGCSTDDVDPAAAATTTGSPSGSPQAESDTAEAAPRRPGPRPGDVQYVALGDSYASAPGVPETDPADGCFRSDSNYAHVLAESADLYLTDVTCSGATSDEVLAEQVPVLTRDTDLVTVGTGGNDLGLFVRVLQSCLAAPDDSSQPASSTCSDVVRDEIEPAVTEIRSKIGAVLDAITDAAPAAEVYVVGYPALLPEEGTCPDLVPIAAEDYPVVAGLTRTLSEALRAEAEARDLAFVDVFAASRDHDICADEPWVNGARTAPDGTIPFHPFAVEQAAVAALVEDMR